MHFLYFLLFEGLGHGADEAFSRTGFLVGLAPWKKRVTSQADDSTALGGKKSVVRNPPDLNRRFSRKHQQRYGFDHGLKMVRTDFVHPEYQSIMLTLTY